MSSRKIPQESVQRQQALTVQQILGPHGRLSHILPGYESRPGQIELAEHCYEQIQDGESLIAEAATGIGKSLGYLVPTLLADEKVIVSTATIVLQAQLQEKDLPLLKEIFPRLTWATIKGRHRYICKREIQKATTSSKMGSLALRTKPQSMPGTKSKHGP